MYCLSPSSTKPPYRYRTPCLNAIPQFILGDGIKIWLLSGVTFAATCWEDDDDVVGPRVTLKIPSSDTTEAEVEGSFAWNLVNTLF